MLTLTENASTVVKSIVEQSGSRGAGRPADQPGLPGRPRLQVVATDAPLPGDRVLEEDGARVFLEQNAAGTLDDKVLDAHVDEAGGVEFTAIRT